MEEKCLFVVSWLTRRSGFVVVVFFLFFSVVVVVAVFVVVVLLFFGGGGGGGGAAHRTSNKSLLVAKHTLIKRALKIRLKLAQKISVKRAGLNSASP